MKIYKIANRQTEYREIGKKYWFEYHCNESHDSTDAQLWYRSHQQVTIIALDEKGHGETKTERLENGHPAVYKIKFDDGFEGGAFEDEVLDSNSEFERPDPPKGQNENI